MQIIVGLISVGLMMVSTMTINIKIIDRNLIIIVIMIVIVMMAAILFTSGIDFTRTLAMVIVVIGVGYQPHYVSCHQMVFP